MNSNKSNAEPLFAEGTRITKVNWSPKADLFPGARAKKKKPSKRSITRLRAMVAAYESDSTLWLLNKSWLSSPEVQKLLRDAFKDKRVTHFWDDDFINGETYSHCTRVVMADEELENLLTDGEANEQGY